MGVHFVELSKENLGLRRHLDSYGGSTAKKLNTCKELSALSTEKMSCLPKPVLRGHLKKKGIQMIIGSLTFAVINASLYHFLIAVPRKEAYEESIRTYDPEAHYKDLVKWGYLNPNPN